MRQEFKEDLKKFQAAYSNEVPTEILHSISPNNKFKVRKGWFSGLVARLECGIMFGDITNPVVVKRVEKGLDRLTSKRFQEKIRTTKRDVLYANLLIDLATSEDV